MSKSKVKVDNEKYFYSERENIVDDESLSVSMNSDVVSMKSDLSLLFSDVSNESVKSSSAIIDDKLYDIRVEGDIFVKDLFQMLLQGSEKQFVVSMPDNVNVSVCLFGKYSASECSRILHVVCEINSISFIEKNNIVYITKHEKEDSIGLSVFCYKFQNIVLDKVMIEQLKEKKSNIQIVNNTLVLVGTDIEIQLVRDIVCSIDVDLFSGFKMIVVETRNSDDYIHSIEDAFRGMGINLQGIASLVKLNSSVVAVVSKNESYLSKIKQIGNLFVQSTLKFRRVIPVKYRSSDSMLEFITKIVQGVNIVSDPVSNRLFVLSNDDDYLLVYDVVKMLDVMPKQLNIKVYLVDVKSSKISDAGLDAVFSTNSFQLSNLNVTKALGGVTAIGSVGNLQSFFTILEKNFDAKIISRSSVYTESGQDAKLKFATSVPYITAVSNTAPVQGIVQNVSYRDVGILINLKGVINENGEIMLVVYVENSMLGNKQGVQDNPVFTTDSLDTKFVMRSNQVAVLGGLKMNSHQQNRKGIPILNRLDYVGTLFGFHDSQDDKREMIVFLCPEIMDPNSLDEIGLNLLDKYKDFLN